MFYTTDTHLQLSCVPFGMKNFISKTFLTNFNSTLQAAFICRLLFNPTLSTSSLLQNSWNCDGVLRIYTFLIDKIILIKSLLQVINYLKVEQGLCISPLMQTISVRSLLECSVICAQAARCAGLAYNAKQCQLTESYDLEECDQMISTFCKSVPYVLHYSVFLFSIESIYFYGQLHSWHIHF